VSPNLTKIGFVILGGAAMGLAFAQQPAGDPVAFQTQTRLVMLPFHAARGNTNLADLSKSDVVLLEDGRPREFSIFDVPSGTDRMPVELVLLFDANPRAGELWNPAGVYQFVKQWNNSMSAALLQSGGADVRVSVYRCAGQKLYRSTPATSDRATLTEALRGVLTPLPSMPEPGSVTELTLPPKRGKVDLKSSYTGDYVTSNFAWAENRGWALEAAIGLLDAISAPGDRVSRVLVIFGQGIGATTTIPEDVGEHALDLGIPIYPVATNYEGLITQFSYPRNHFRMRQFEALGKMTGGRSFEYQAIDAGLLQKILNEVKGHVLEQYVVGFAPDSHAAPRQHNLEVRPLAPASATIEGGKRRAVY
jgi:hypothetical protein